MEAQHLRTTKNYLWVISFNITWLPSPARESYSGLQEWSEETCSILGIYLIQPSFHHPKMGKEKPVVLEKTLESPLDCKEIQPVHPKGDQSWVFIGRTAAEAETAILWPPDAKS